MHICGPEWLTLDDHIDISGTLWGRVPTLQELTELPGPHRIILFEPAAVLPWDYKFVDTHHKLFYQILTFDEVLLSRYRNTTPVYFGTSWIPLDIAEVSVDFPKRSGISLLCGYAHFTFGHAIRRAIYDSQIQLERVTGAELHFYRSSRGEPIPSNTLQGNPFIYQDKSALHLPYRYSIVIENSDEPNYFSEKLIDCLLCRSIPIYWGCRNIDMFFDVSGIILLRGGCEDVLQQLAEILPTCTEELYSTLQPVIEINHKRCYNYAYNHLPRISSAIRNFIPI